VPKFARKRKFGAGKNAGIAVGWMWTRWAATSFHRSHRMARRKQFTMTGHLGEVMQESDTGR